MRVERYRSILALLFVPWLVTACTEPRFIDDAGTIENRADADAEPMKIVDAASPGQGDAATTMDAESRDADSDAERRDAEPQAAEGRDADLKDAESRDAESKDAESRVVLRDPNCFDDPKVLGAECPVAVWCTSFGLCDKPNHICCVSELTSECSARLDCDYRPQLRCDGAEDCANGNVCCFRDGATVCVPNSECEETNRACHRHEDCDLNRCVEGILSNFAGVPVLFVGGAGFCRGR